MNKIKYILPGIFFGIVLTKSEAVSWFRIQEMFRFESFHMYGLIGTAVVISAIIVALVKKFNLKDITGQPIVFEDKEKSFIKYIGGGTLFGLGWGMSGTCPGPIYTLLGHGIWVVAIIFVSAILGTFVYGLVKNKLPH